MNATISPMAITRHLIQIDLALDMARNELVARIARDLGRYHSQDEPVSQPVEKVNVS